MKHHADITDDILVALRRVIRAIDLHSRKLAQSHGLTGPQALLLSEIVRSGSLTGSELAKRVSLSQATVTDIVKRLEKRNLLERAQDTGDRRKFLLRATEDGQMLVNKSLPLLQERFQSRLAGLKQWEQTQLLASLQRIAEMMDAEDLDAAPLLTSGPVTASAEAISPNDALIGTSGDDDAAQ